MNGKARSRLLRRTAVVLLVFYAVLVAFYVYEHDFARATFDLLIAYGLWSVACKDKTS